LAASGASNSPEMMRRRLKTALRQYREAANFTQRAAAEYLDWSASKIIRIESGAVGITPTDLRALLGLYGIDDQKLVSELVELARGSRTQPWRQYSDVYSQASLTLFANEAAAQIIYKYESTVVPGLLQTEEYARALLEGLRTDIDYIDRRVSARLERQELLDREDRPDLQFILGEAAMSCVVGGRAVMARQLDLLKYIATRPRICIQVLPFSAGAHPGMGGAFTILEFADKNLDDLLYLENAGGESTDREDPDLIANYRRNFLALQEMACAPEAFGNIVDLTKKRLEEYDDRPSDDAPP
jgi:transcriptional regulator with XRE-family HTH domain